MVDGKTAHGGRREAAQRIVAPVAAGLLLLVTLLALIGTAIRDPKPHDIAVGLVGPAPATAQISGAFAQNAPGTFAFTTYSSEAEARTAIDNRDVDGALVIGAGGGRRARRGRSAPGRRLPTPPGPSPARRCPSR